MNRGKKIMAFAVVAIFALSSIGCSRGGAISNETKSGVDALNTIIKTYPDKIGFHKALEHWGFKLPTGEKFEWTKNMGANKADFAMVMLADPFIAAGLDVNKLDKKEWIFKPAGKDEGTDLPNLLIKPYNVSYKKQNSNGTEDALRRILQEEDQNLLKYHKAMQRYRLLLGEGNEVQWTEKLGLNNAERNDLCKGC